MDYVKMSWYTNVYAVDESNNDQLGLLGMFLTDDVGPSFDFWHDWVLDDTYDFTASNYSQLEKEGDFIVMSCQFDDDPYEDALEISKDNLIYILKQWKSLRELRPREIIISREGNKYTMEGKDFPPMETLKDINYN